MREILKSRQLVENLRLSSELLLYAFHKTTVKQKILKIRKFLIEEIGEIIQLLFYTYICI